jgi:hypothetical protein
MKLKNLIAALVTVTSSVALAQEATPPAPASETAAPPVEAAPEAGTSAGMDDRMTTTEGKVTSIEEQLLEIKSALSPLQKLKLSGYVQARYQYETTREDGTGGFSRFTVRRSRLKATYSDDWAQFVLQIDATPSAVALRDAEATLYIPGTKQSQSVTLGQMKLPFGYEGPHSSSDREFPERTRLTQSFLPGERDRGIRYAGKFGALRVAAGVFDGNSITLASDNDKEKDVVGRVGVDLKWISGGVSGWYGTTIRPRQAATATQPFVSSKAFARNRLGADLQVYLDVLPLGGTALKGEYVAGSSYYRNNVEQYGTPANGWYALLVQNLGVSNAVAVRYDYFDYAAGTPARVDSRNATQPAGTNAVGTLGVAVLHYFGENLKATLAYEMPTTVTVQDAKDPVDNLLTFQLQARF